MKAKRKEQTNRLTVTQHIDNSSLSNWGNEIKVRLTLRAMARFAITGNLRWLNRLVAMLDSTGEGDRCGEIPADKTLLETSMVRDGRR